jgi:drug/metabolite transporter (DMT)-like permease
MTIISSNDAILKISGESMGVGQLLFVRGVFAYMMFMLMIRLTNGPVICGSVVNRWNLFRATCECPATFCFVNSLGNLSIATASTRVWTVPILLTIGSAFFLGDKVSISQWIVVFVGFISVLLVTNPFGGGFSWVMVLPMMVAGFVVVRDMTTRRIDSETSSVLYRAGHIIAGSHGGRACFIA